MIGKKNMEFLATKFGTSLSLSEKEKGGIKIEKKAVKGALLGFHYSVVVEVFSTKAVNENGIIDQFTSLWRGREGCQLGHSVGLDLVVDGACHGQWAEPFHLATMWVQLHNVSPLNMTEVIASTIGGLIGKVAEGANVEFPNDGMIWINFHYEGLPNYCLICGKVEHVTQWCKVEKLGEEASEDSLGGVDPHGRRAVEAEEKEHQRVEREKAFDASFIGLGGSITPETGMIVLENHPEKLIANGESTEVMQPSHNIDLNIPIVVEHDGFHDRTPEREGGMKRSREDDGTNLEVIEEDLTCAYKIPRFGRDQAEATYEGSPRS
ncbi:hypothetical protein DVH24_034534 [Malus domestica]|uniref:Zinc knuckle CX2CX4HX4C domain-containing protein n=1 Tax=Malus domestica TaxID=3750 RepID=A0A498IZV6_MALDO|nr:hypothetical protein DVH24_034534 [Malus domestica]